MYPHGLDASAWVAFFESETREIDILHRHDPGSNAPDIAKLVETFPAKARTRLMATRATTATLAPKPEQRFRSFSKDFSHDLYRADSELLIRQHSFGQADSPGPIVHVVDMGRPDGLFATYIEAFEAAWRA